MPLSVLTDDQIRELFEGLTLDELDSFCGALKAALHEYSVGTLGTQDNPAHYCVQPERQAICSAANGTMTLFMPSGSPAGLGIKVITLTSPKSKIPAAQGSHSSGNNSRDAIPDTTKGKDAAPPSTPVVRPTGAITLFSAQGEPVAILHASQLTAFRTALASLCLVQRRASVRVITVFGAGLQAFYHVRLALMARGHTVRQVNIISHRYSDSCRNMLRRFLAVPAEAKTREGWEACKFEVLTPGYVEYDRLLKEQVRAADVIFCCTPSTHELFPASLLTNNEGRKKGRLLIAIGSYTPEMIEIPVEVIRQAVKRHQGSGPHFHKHATEGGAVIVDTLDGALKEAGELIAAGLRPDQLVELGELVMLHEEQLKDSEAPSSPQAEDGVAGEGRSSSGSVAALDSSSPDDLEKLEITAGRPSMSSIFGSAASKTSSRSSSPSRGSTAPSMATASTTDSARSGGSGSSGIVLPFLYKRSSSFSSENKKKDDHLARWLQTGNVIYKSVGLGLMDLTVGMHLVRFARDKGVGTHVEAF